MFICGSRLSKTHGCFWHRLSLVKQGNCQLEGDFVLFSKFQVDNFGKKIIVAELQIRAVVVKLF